MTREEFVKWYGMEPEMARQIMKTFRQLVNSEVQEAIEHADYYMNPLDYCDADTLKERYGEDALEKDEDSDGYPNLYEWGTSHGAVSTFKNLISWRTTHGGHASAMEACELMGLEWEADR